MPEIKNTENVRVLMDKTVSVCRQYRHEFVMPEHMLLALLAQNPFRDAVMICLGDCDDMEKKLKDWLIDIEKVPEEIDYSPTASSQMGKVIGTAYNQVVFSNSTALDVPHVVEGLLSLEESKAQHILASALQTSMPEFLSTVIEEYNGEQDEDDDDSEIFDAGSPDTQAENKQVWRSLVLCLNDHIDESHPLIGREQELERTIQVLCRKDKNNPLHVGEPGVGKTALVYGLAARIEKGEVPEKLKGSRIYLLDLGSLIAGTQFRGDFEKRIKSIMDGLEQEEDAIVYIDEIHNLVGAGRTGDGSMDASNMLKPYLESGKIRFIGSTTYDEYNRHFSKSKGLVRRFQQIDLLEPSEEEAVKILEGLKDGYEAFHGVTYADGSLQYAVHASAKYVNDRFLPDKAIDLIDEAGAYRQIHAEKDGNNVVDKTLLTEVLSKMCKVDLISKDDDENEAIMKLQERMSALIYGQDEAITKVVEAVQMSKAGLNDDNKPLASLLFVGPTGVGKTEVARVLAQKMGVELVRFDMSEYTEKHTVAKLIGSPAGYVGYEDGGLLTDAIRKTPHCVLLLDEIEKAHSDIYNILLQVMDYARLTDNKGRKADFRNVVLIMTSNAGAQFASRASVGFGAHVTAGEAMLAQVKKTFKPEFINRLSATVTFNDMDKNMAGLILDKKLRELQAMLSAKNVTMHLSEEARELLLEKGFTKEYGARELDRVVGRMLKPLFMREILFGRLKEGGSACVGVEAEQLVIKEVSK